MNRKPDAVVLLGRSCVTLPPNDNSLCRDRVAQAMRMSSHPSDQDYLTELAPVLSRRFADLLLFCVTSMALAFLFLLTPSFGIVGWLYVLQHLLVLGFALTRSEPLTADH